MRWRELRRVVCVCAVVALGGCGSERAAPDSAEADETAGSTVSQPSTDASGSAQPESTSTPSISTRMTTTEPPPERTEGDVAICNNGDYSNNADFSATCSSADGVREWLARYALCDNYTLVRLEDGRPCDGGKSAFVRLLDDDEPTVLAVDAFGTEAMNRLRCTSVDGPVSIGGVDGSFACTSSSGGVAFVAGGPGLGRLDVTKMLMTDPSYDAIASTFVAFKDSDTVVFALSDFAFWGNDGPDFDQFDAIDTDCLNPGLDDPALCGPAPGAVPDLLCVRLDLAEEALRDLDLPEPVLIDATGEGRSVFLAENWIVVDQSPASFAMVSDQIQLAVVKASDSSNPCP